MPPKKRPCESSLEPSKMKVGELKEELEKRGLETAGKKAELVARLEDSLKGPPCPSKRVKVETADAKPMEETDFSKAVCALTTSSKKKTPTTSSKRKERKVDVYCDIPDTYVVDDWDCMLNQTNIGNNNNKFYIMQLLDEGETYFLWTRWGRVGEVGQHAVKSYAERDEATADFKKKFQDKTKNQWDKRDQFVPVPGKYTLIEMDEEDQEYDQEMALKLAALDEPDCGTVAPTKIRPCTLDQPTQNLVKTIFDSDMFKYAMKSLEIDTKKMPLGKLSKIQIAKGFEALEAVETALDANASKSKLAELTSKFYTIIPHDFGRKVPPPIVDKETLQKKFDMLMVLGDIELAQGMQKSETKVKTEREGQTVAHHLDNQYESLKAELTLLEPSSHEHQVISKYMEATKPERWNLQLEHVWRVKRETAGERFQAHDSITNRRLLWHGTNVAVVAAILKSGLRIMPHSGGRVGKGIYLASENGKSAGHMRSTDNRTGFMFLNEAALGKEKLITIDDSTLTSPPKGYDSVVAKGRMEPDPKCDTTLTLDGKSVKVPQGKPVPTRYHSYSRFGQSEYLVYRESQTCIRYMVQMKL